MFCCSASISWAHAEEEIEQHEGYAHKTAEAAALESGEQLLLDELIRLLHALHEVFYVEVGVLFQCGEYYLLAVAV